MVHVPHVKEWHVRFFSISTILRLSESGCTGVCPYFLASFVEWQRGKPGRITMSKIVDHVGYFADGAEDRTCFLIIPDHLQHVIVGR